jgi:tetratricopeptide (TPR) repeat protein
MIFRHPSQPLVSFFRGRAFHRGIALSILAGNHLFYLENQSKIIYYSINMKDSLFGRKGLVIISAIAILFLFLNCADKEKDFESLKRAGMAALESDDYNHAVDLLKKAYLIKPSDRDILFNLAVAFKKMSMTDSAFAYFHRAQLLYARDRDINKELLDLYMAAKDVDGVLNTVGALIAAGDNEQIYWPILAEYCYRKGDPEGAVKYYRLLISADPTKKSYYLLLSGILSRMNEFSQSNDVLFKAINLFGFSAECYANAAVNYVGMKNLTKAEDFFRKSLAINAGNIPTWINLANNLSSQQDKNKKREALEIYKKYRSQTPPEYGLDSLINTLESELQSR